jgi:integrase
MGKLTVEKRGTTWQYSFEGAGVNGKRNRIKKSGFRTKLDAQTAGIEAQAEFNKAGLNFVPSEISYSDFLDLWVEDYCKVNLKEVTIMDYNKKIRLHIKPELGTYKLKALTTTVMQKFINNIAKQNYSRNTLSVIKGILSGGMRYAVEKNLIRLNPMVNVTLPSPRNEKLKPRKNPHVYIPPNRIDEIFARFPEGSSPHVAMMFGYKGGLRIGEAFGECWDDVDFNECTISINRQVQWDETKKLWYFSDPKYDSFRTIDMDEEFMELIWRVKERQDKAKEYYGDLYTLYYENENRELNTVGDGKPVSLINIRENGEFIIPRTMQHTSEIIHQKLNYPEFDFHSLRNTHASMLAENDAPPKYLQYRMGHKNLEITMKFYIKLTDKMKENGAEVLKKLYPKNKNSALK